MYEAPHIVLARQVPSFAMALNLGPARLTGLFTLFYLTLFLGATSGCQAPTTPLMPDPFDRSPFPEDYMAEASLDGRAGLRAGGISEDTGESRGGRLVVRCRRRGRFPISGGRVAHSRGIMNEIPVAHSCNQLKSYCVDRVVRRV